MPAQDLIDRYREQAKQLLPPGRALSRRMSSHVVSLLEGVAVECARVHERAAALIGELSPDQADELLPEWEKATGLPECTDPSTTQGRQDALVAKLVASGDQSEATFQQIAASANAYATLHDAPLPTSCVDDCEDPVAGHEWYYHSRVDALVPNEYEELLKCRMDAHGHLYGSLTYDIEHSPHTPAMTDVKELTTQDGRLLTTHDGSSFIEARGA